MESTEKQFDTIADTVIVGAGIAGLYLAWRLSKEGKPFVLIEKDPYCGGRIRTEGLSIPSHVAKDSEVKETRLELLPAELGAMRFTDRHVIFRKLIQKLGFDKVPFEFPGSYYLRGRFLTKEDFWSGALYPQAIPYDLPPSERGRTPHELVPYVIKKVVADCYLKDEIDPESLKRQNADLDFDNLEEQAKEEQERKVEFERIKSKLLRSIDRILDEHWFPREEELKPEEWDVFRKLAHLSIRGHATKDPLPLALRHVGFWNLLKHYLSDEGFHLVNDGFGFASVVANWQAAEAMRWCIEDYGPAQKFYGVQKYKAKEEDEDKDHQVGITGVVEALQREIEAKKVGAIQLNHELIEIAFRDGKFELKVIEKKGTDDNIERLWSCEKLVLCLPTRASERIQFTNLSSAGHKKWRRLVRTSWPHRMVKIVLLYEEAWWKHTRLPGGDSGRVFTDIPERQIFYFGPEWLAKAGYTPAGHGLLMVYNDSRFTNFWRPFSEDVNYWFPDSEERSIDAWFGRRLKPTSKKPKRGSVIRWRLVDKITLQLKALHKYNVPDPIDGIWMDWTDSGAWHTWWPHVDIPATVKKMLQPLDPSDFEGGAAQGKSIPLYVCGEAYSDEQGWMEGALKSAEAVATRLGCEQANKSWFHYDDNDIRRVDYRYDDSLEIADYRDHDFKSAGYENYGIYMRHYSDNEDNGN
jgi:monoamine oxidase